MATLSTLAEHPSGAVLSLAALYVLCTAVYRLLLHPLRHVPGPWYAAVSEIWLAVQTLKFKQNIGVHSLIEMYGPVVRIAPNKVVFCDGASIKKVYANPKFNKSPFYKMIRM